MTLTQVSLPFSGKIVHDDVFRACRDENDDNGTKSTDAAASQLSWAYSLFRFFGSQANPRPYMANCEHTRERSSSESSRNENCMYAMRQQMQMRKLDLMDNYN